MIPVSNSEKKEMCKYDIQSARHTQLTLEKMGIEQKWLYKKFNKINGFLP